MKLPFGGLRQFIFGVSPEEGTFARRGFHQVEDDVQAHLETIGRTFLGGYNAALLESAPKTLAQQFSKLPLEFRGFAFEGAAMSLSLLDRLTPWKRNRLLAFLEGPGSDHIYMVYIGVGWALARLHCRLERTLGKLDSLLRWLVVDGYGFHEGYFHPQLCVRNQNVPKHLSGYARRAFDQGLGRSLWFVEGADVSQIPETIARFPESRHVDLWSGVGLACAYAGGRDRASIEMLHRAAGFYYPQLAQGASFAAKARQRAGNRTSNTELACEILCGMPLDQAADITDVAQENLPSDCADPAYEVWRQRVQTHFAKEKRK